MNSATVRLAEVSWEEFRSRLLALTARRPEWSNQLLFRGLGRSTWTLRTTLDRYLDQLPNSDRATIAAELIDQFQREALNIVSELPEGDALELLARHHGLPSPLLDWTTSPYVAAYFAFADSDPLQEESVAVWVLDRNVLPESDEIRLIDAPELLRFNSRALRQRGVFLRIGTSDALEPIFGASLTQYQLPIAD